MHVCRTADNLLKGCQLIQAQILTALTTDPTNVNNKWLMRSLVGKAASWIFLLPNAGRPLRHCIWANVLPNYNLYFLQSLCFSDASINACTEMSRIPRSSSRWTMHCATSIRICLLRGIHWMKIVVELLTMRKSTATNFIYIGINVFIHISF